MKMTPEEFLRWMEGQYNREIVLRSKVKPFQPPGPEMRDALLPAIDQRPMRPEMTRAVGSIAGWAILSGIGFTFLLICGPSILNGISLGAGGAILLGFAFPGAAVIVLIVLLIMLAIGIGCAADSATRRAEREAQRANIQAALEAWNRRR